MNEYLQKLNNKTEKKLISEMKQYAMDYNVPIIQNDSLSCILCLLDLIKAKRILEIGTAIGYSSICFVENHPERVVDTIERNEEMYKEAQKNISQGDYDKQINVYFEDALLIDNDKLNKQYDVIFIDAAKAQYQKFFEKYTPLLNKTGIVITDNILFHGCVENQNQEELTKNMKNIAKKIDIYNHYLSNLEEFTTYFINIGDGLAVTVHK